MSNLNKDVFIQLENTATYEAKSELNVTFRTADSESAVFYFNVTKHDKPLLLGDENVKARIAIRKQGVSVIAPIEIEDAFNGLLKYKLPNDVLQRDGKYTAQVLVSETGESNVAVAERIFTFDVEKSLFSGIDAETKLSYIVEFQELERIIIERANAIDTALKNGEDYVTQLENARAKGLSDIQIALTNALSKIKTQETASLKVVKDKGDEYSANFDSAKQYIDTQSASFKESVKASGLVTNGASANWQKYKITEDDGKIKLINLNNDLTALHGLSPGMVYTTNTPHGLTDKGISTAGYTTMIIRQSVATKKLVFMPYNSNRIIVKWFYNDVWSDWQELSLADPNNPFETTTGSQAKANTAEGNAKVYTNKVVAQTNEVIFSGSAKGVGAVMTLKKPYTDYDEIKIFAYGHGASECYVRNTDPNRRIVMYSFNLTDSDASNGDIVETQVERTNSTSFKIASVGAYNLPTATGTVNSNLGLEIYKIVGVRYYANLNQQ
ncbi:phage baseplate upper protein [Staphylococcus sp. GDX8P107P-1]|uniref:phage baseplate upper protein n=1 Tax=Staphylococcus sp. GDX8P107P-1 TaxID=2804109 RepID=UPI001AEC5EB2|nr:phage baseplate upper protein [Staphylococcus sp. GDX8P107P-1]